MVNQWHDRLIFTHPRGKFVVVMWSSGPIVLLVLSSDRIRSLWKDTREANDAWGEASTHSFSLNGRSRSQVSCVHDTAISRQLLFLFAFFSVYSFCEKRHRLFAYSGRGTWKVTSDRLIRQNISNRDQVAGNCVSLCFTLFCFLSHVRAASQCRLVHHRRREETLHLLTIYCEDKFA